MHFWRRASGEWEHATFQISMSDKGCYGRASGQWHLNFSGAVVSCHRLLRCSTLMPGRSAQQSRAIYT